MKSIQSIFPMVRVRILWMLFSDPSKEYYLRELARLTRMAIGTLQQEVARLRKAGLLLARREANRLYYRANPEASIFPELQGIARKIKFR